VVKRNKATVNLLNSIKAETLKKGEHVDGMVPERIPVALRLPRPPGLGT